MAYLMLIESPDYRAGLEEDGLIRVTPREPLKLAITTPIADGAAVREEKALEDLEPNSAEHRLLAALQRHPLALLAHDEGGDWSMDIQAGMSRWRGIQSQKKVRKGFYNLGFLPKDVSILLRAARKFIGVPVPRVG